MVAVIERSPAAFRRMKEGELRQHFLVQLNGYEGQATGETFNFEGKTHVLIGGVSGRTRRSEDELASGQLNRRTRLRYDPRGRIQTDLSDLELASTLGEFPEAHDRSDTRGELSRRERLHDVVVRPQLEAEHPIDLLPTSLEHDDRHVRALANLRGEVASVAVGSVTSRRITSGGWSWNASRASLSEAATSAANPCRSSVSASGFEIVF